MTLQENTGRKVEACEDGILLREFTTLPKEMWVDVHLLFVDVVVAEGTQMFSPAYQVHNKLSFEFYFSFYPSLL